VELTYRQAEELAAWLAGVTSITCTPWAMADVLRGWIDPEPDTAAATLVFAEPDGSDPNAVVLGPADADRFVTPLQLGIEDRRVNELLIRTSSPYQCGQRASVSATTPARLPGVTGIPEEIFAGRVKDSGGEHHMSSERSARSRRRPPSGQCGGAVDFEMVVQILVAAQALVRLVMAVARWLELLRRGQEGRRLNAPAMVVPIAADKEVQR
jgi:hypothetical protein